MNIKAVRAVISTLLIITGVMSYGTGAVLYFSSTGMWFVFSRGFIKTVHAVSTVTMGSGIIVHLIINMKMYIGELKSMRKKK